VSGTELKQCLAAILAADVAGYSRLMTADECATVAALDAAREVFRVRISVHLGDVIGKADGPVYGDGVNIAAQLEGLAELGGITVSESIRAAVRGDVSAIFEDQGEQTVKNIA
jgi:class 3 adenylate cyclase